MESLSSSPVFLQIVEIAQKVLGALVITVAGFWLSGRVERWVVRLSGRTARIDETLGAFLAGLARIAVIIVAIITALELIGVGTAYIALLGAAGLALALAMQGTVSHVASGVMLLVLRPFKVGDFIEAGGTSGTVRAISLFATDLATPDNVKATVPNGALWSGIVRNYTAYGTRRLELEFGIGYEHDIDKAMNVIETIVGADTRVHAQPEPVIALGGLTDKSVQLVLRVWCDASDCGALRSDLIKAVKEAFDREGIRRPDPRGLVRRVGAKPGEAA